MATTLPFLIQHQLLGKLLQSEVQCEGEVPPDSAGVLSFSVWAVLRMRLRASTSTEVLPLTPRSSNSYTRSRAAAPDVVSHAIEGIGGEVFSGGLGILSNEVTRHTVNVVAHRTASKGEALKSMNGCGHSGVFFHSNTTPYCGLFVAAVALGLGKAASMSSTSIPAHWAVASTAALSISANIRGRTIRSWAALEPTSSAPLRSNNSPGWAVWNAGHWSV